MTISRAPQPCLPRRQLASRGRRWALTLALLPGLACVVEPDEDDPTVDAPEDDEDDAQPRIAGPNELAEPQTMLIRYWSGPTMRGSSTLIAPNVVLSNAHATFGSATGMYLQRGTQTVAGKDPLQVLEKRHHPNYSSPGDAHDIALLRLGCNVVDIAPAAINRTALVGPDIASGIKAVGYGPSGANLLDWGTKRSASGLLSGFSSAWINVTGVSAFPGDSGGSLHGYPSGIVGPGDEGGPDADDIYPQRKLIGVVTYSNGRSLRVDAHAPWIDSVVAGWIDPGLPSQPLARTIAESSHSKYCPQGTTPGHYAITSPEANVTYTWHATGATIAGSGTSVIASPATTQPYTISVTATGPGGCARMFSAVFVPQTAPCVADPT